MRNIDKVLGYDCDLAPAKMIALDTRNGPNTPDVRAKIFQFLDHIADQDLIYRAGIESAPLLKKRQQCLLVDR